MFAWCSQGEVPNYQQPKHDWHDVKFAQVFSLAFLKPVGYLCISYERPWWLWNCFLHVFDYDHCKHNVLNNVCECQRANSAQSCLNPLWKSLKGRIFCYSDHMLCPAICAFEYPLLACSVRTRLDEQQFQKTHRMQRCMATWHLNNRKPACLIVLVWWRFMLATQANWALFHQANVVII